MRFAPMGPHLGLEISEVMDRVIDLKNGPEYLVRHIMYPSVPTAYAEVMEAVREARPHRDAPHHVRRADRRGKDRDALDLHRHCPFVVFLAF